MIQTFSVVLSNRFNDAERVIGLFSSTGYKIEKMAMANDIAAGELSHLLVVTEMEPEKVANFRTRLSQQVRVFSVECFEGDQLPDHQELNK